MPKVSAERPKGYPVKVYCDESLDRGGYDILGGLWLTRPDELRLQRKITKLRKRTGYATEFKWQKASGRMLHDAYREFAELVVGQIKGGRGGFHCIVIPKRFMDYEKYHGGDQELAFYKFWQLLFRKKVEPGTTYIFYLDRRTNRLRTRLSDLRRFMNVCGTKDHGLGYDCCRDVVPVDSKANDLIQAADLLVGAVGFHWGKGHLAPKASLAKIELASRIAQRLGHQTLDFGTPATEQTFNIWPWRPKLG